MQYALVGLSSFAIGFSGALMPGPLLGLSIDIGIKKGVKGGFALVMGHVLLDLVTLILLMVGLKDIMTNPIVSALVGIVGGAILFYMGYTMFVGGYKNKVTLDNLDYHSKNNSWYRLMLKGASASISNPYYIIWWASVGLALVISATPLGLMGIVMVYMGHILSDIIWICFVAYTMHKSQKIMSQKTYRGIILGIGAFVACFGIYFVYMGFGFI